jgi:hypothetical protein
VHARVDRGAISRSFMYAVLHEAIGTL